jgi:uncharacterized tellurite resistance protein B-like protein
MPFFSKLRSSTPPDEALPRAVMTPAVSAIMADGDMQAEEVSQLSNLCSFSPVFAHIHPERLAEMVRELIAETMEKGGDTTLREAAASLSPRMSETAFCFVARIVMADGTITDEEEEALQKIAEILEVPAGTVAQIVDVVKMMQRKPHED